jgi:hypothetical protein
MHAEAEDAHEDVLARRPLEAFGDADAELDEVGAH